MEPYTQRWHTSHMQQEDGLQTMVVYLEGHNAKDAVSLSIHVKPCAMCCAFLAEAVWAEYRVDKPSHFEVTEITDTPPATPSEA